MLIYLALVLGCVSPVFSSGVEDLGILTREIETLRLREKTWDYGLALILGEQDPRGRLSVDDFTALPPGEKQKLTERDSRFSHLIGLIRPETLAREKVQVAKLREKVRGEYRTTAALRRLFSSHLGSEIRIDNKLLDDLLELDYARTEQALPHSTYPLWAVIGWDEQGTQTWYEEIRSVFQLKAPGAKDVVYDLGSGYGRFLFYGALVFPGTKFRGIELVKERVEKARGTAERLGLENLQFFAGDVLQSDFGDGTIFYLFNSFPADVTSNVLRRLRLLSQKKRITLITLHDPGPQLLRAEWLKLVAEDKEFRYIRVFESVPVPK